VIATPFVFLWETDGLQLLAADRGFADYVLSVFGSALRVLGVPTVCLGLVFPYLLKLAEPWGRGAGRTVGELAALNTLGAVLGSVSAGFLLLETMGLWASLGGVAALYLAAGAAVLFRWRPIAAAAAALALALLFFRYDPTALPLLPAPEDPDAVRILETLEGTAGTVAVVDEGGNVRMKLNSSYGLGGSGDRHQEVRQAHFPLVLHPDPKRAFFLGLGTGITAGAALQHPLEELWVAELVPEVVEASQRHFEPWVGDLFEDPRVQLRIEDGRNVLLGERERFDVIVADLFLPWKAGTGSLYAREHYEAARKRLAPGGLYAQWLLLIQLSRAEFGAIARTLVEVFPRVTLWRGNFRTTHPLVLLVGEVDPEPLDPAALTARLRAIEDNDLDRSRLSGENAPIPETKEKLLYMYLGNLSAAGSLLDEFAVNSDARPVIEYSAPVTHRRKRTGDAQAFRYQELLDFYDAVFAAAPPETDPVLADTPAPLRNLPRAGLEFERGRTLQRLGEEEASKQAFSRSHEFLRRAYAPSE
jgi:spermidine synthase